MHKEFLQISVTIIRLSTVVVCLLAKPRNDCSDFKSTADTFLLNFQDQKHMPPMFWDYRISPDPYILDTDAFYIVNCKFSDPESSTFFSLSCNFSECTLIVSSSRADSEICVPTISVLASTCNQLSGSNNSSDNTMQLVSQILDLHMAHNDIAALHENCFDILRRLTRLFLADNSFKTTDDFGSNADCQRNLSRQSSVTYLDLSTNLLTTIKDDAFCHFSNLTELYLSGNEISVIESGAFRLLKSLEVLDLSYNALKTLPVEVFHSQTNLLLLDLSDNPFLNDNIYACLKPLRNLKGLTMKHNNISSVKSEHLVALQSLMALYLERNQMKLLEDSKFTLVRGLKFLDLAENGIQTIPSIAFQPLINLIKLNLNGNRIESFSGGIFGNYTGLEELYVSGNHLNGFPELGRLRNLQKLIVSHNKIETITVSDYNRLCNLVNLRQLDMSSNRIQQIYPGVFDCNRNLEKLNLNGNQIKQITSVFSNSKIYAVNLKGNYIQSLSYDDISVDMSELDVSCNQILHFDGHFTDRLSKMMLRKLNCASNQLSEIHNLSFPSANDSFQADFRYNQLSSITFGKPVNHSNSIRVQFQHNALNSLCTLLMYTQIDVMATFQMVENPLKCACEIEFFNYKSDAVEIKTPYASDSTCPKPLLWPAENSSASDNGNLIRNATHFSCTKNSLKSMCQCNRYPAYHDMCGLTCPDYCTCFLYSDFRTQLINCTGSHLGEIPESLVDNLSIILRFSFNNLKSLTNSTLASYSHATELYLDHNQIASIEVGALNYLPLLEILHLENNVLTQLPAGIFDQSHSLVEIDLSHNDLFYLDDDIFQALKKLTILNLSSNSLIDLPVWRLFENVTTSDIVLTLSLRNNPWSCNCSYLGKFRSFLQYTRIFVEDAKQLYCSPGTENNTRQSALISFDSDFCSNSVAPVYFMSYVAIWSSVLISLVVISLVSILIFVYRKELQVLVYSRYGWRIFHKKAENSSTEMLYDAFIAHSSYDEEFVITKLIPGLEGIENPYHLCVHQRDFLAGAIITESIMEAVERSQRTIVVMSDQFVNSEWCRFEFQTAHLKTLSDRCNRLIVIILDKIPNNLDPKMNLYLKTNTYLKWGERFFWEKLYFALPYKNQQV